MLGLKAGGERLKQPLSSAHDWRGATHMLQHQEPTTGSQYTERLAGRRRRIRDRTEAEGAAHGVETLVLEPRERAPSRPRGIGARR